MSVPSRPLSAAVCLTVRNGDQYLDAQLESIGRQSRRPVELVVGDDGSSDGSVAKVERFVERIGIELRVLRHEPAVGAVQNGASTFAAAHADVILPCDQDDIWHVEKIDRLCRALEENAEAAGAFCDSDLIAEDGSSLSCSLWQTLSFEPSERRLVSAGRGLSVLARRNVVAAHALAFRRGCCDLVLPVPEVVHHLDWWVALLLAASGPLVPVPERLVSYRLHGRNAVGLRSRTSVRRRLDSTSATARSTSDALSLAAVLERLSDCAPAVADEARRVLEPKIAHAEARARLGTKRASRFLPVAAALASGAYRRHANGWRSAVFDLLRPAQPSRPIFLSAGTTARTPGSLAAVVVNYNGGDCLVECVRSLRAEGVADVIVVDNGSTDGSLDVLRHAIASTHVVESPTNLGYGGGVNLGASMSKAEMLLVCNADIVLTPGSLKHLVDRMRSSADVAIVGPRLVDADGRTQLSTRRFPSFSRSWRQAFLGMLRPERRRALAYSEANRRLADAGDVDWVTGACLLVRGAAFDDVAGFDTGYFMYVEEVDLCWRLRQRGWSVQHEAKAVVRHVGGVSTATRPYAMTVAHHRSLWRFACRSADGWEVLMLPLAALGIAARCAVAVVRQRVSGGRVSAPGARRPT